MKQAVIQIGYITHSLENSLKYWTEVVEAGPFYLAEYAPIDQVYRGSSTDSRFRLAYGYAGDMNIELVEPINDAPSAYAELFDTGRTSPVGGMFHHVMMQHDDYDKTYAGYLAAGAERCFDAVVPGVGRYCYLDARSLMDCYVELLDICPAFDAARAKMRDIHRNWDGRHPIRSFDEIVSML